MEKKKEKFKPENLKEFKALIKRYLSITLEEIEEAVDEEEDSYHPIKEAKGELTGFGFSNSCTLCNIINRRCNECVWSKGREYKSDYSTLWCVDNSKTYTQIEEATTPEELLLAYKKRAKYMKLFLKRYYNIDYDLDEVI